MSASRRVGILFAVHSVNTIANYSKRKQLFTGKKKFNVFQISFINLSEICQIPLTFFCFLRQYMAFKRMLSFYLSCSGQRKSLLGTRICFHFWHFSVINMYLKLLFLFGREGNNHPFPFKPGKLLNFPVILKVVGKA